MSRYQAAIGIEVEYQPGSHSRVLRNLPAITCKSDMDRAEYIALITAQVRYYSESVDTETQFDAAFIR